MLTKNSARLFYISITLISSDQSLLEEGIFWPVTTEFSSVRGKLMGIVLVTRVSFSFLRKILTLWYLPSDVAQHKRSVRAILSIFYIISYLHVLEKIW